jgi:glutathione S-transferase
LAYEARWISVSSRSVVTLTRESGEGAGMSERTLYRLQACPFCERVVRRLNELDLDYESRFVMPLHSERDAVKRAVGVRTVPALLDERTGVAMAESATIVSYLDRTYGDGGGA